MPPLFSHLLLGLITKDVTEFRSTNLEHGGDQLNVLFFTLFSGRLDDKQLGQCK